MHAIFIKFSKNILYNIFNNINSARFLFYVGTKKIPAMRGDLKIIILNKKLISRILCNDGVSITLALRDGPEKTVVGISNSSLSGGVTATANIGCKTG